MEAPENQNEILELFKQGPSILENALAGLSDSELDYTPSNGGWTIRQIVHHISDGDDLWKIVSRLHWVMNKLNSVFSGTWHSRR